MVSFATEAEARAFAEAARANVPSGVTLAHARTAFLESLEQRGLRPASVVSHRKHLQHFCASGALLLSEISPASIEAWYRKRQPDLAVASHRVELAAVKRLLAFCVEHGWLGESAAAGVKPVGRPRRGKPQLRIGEAQALSRHALEAGARGDDGAVAVLLGLWLGMRSGEIRGLRVRDLDIFDGGCWLWIDDGKTENARRHLEVPADLVPLLQQRTREKTPLAYLFHARRSSSGQRDQSWLNDVTRRLCREAGVPEVPPHGLRGTWASLAEEAGAVAHLVSAQLGHGNHAVTAAHYLASGVEDRAKSRRALTLIGGTSKNAVEVPASETAEHHSGNRG